ncbi:MAG: hypothetical protein Pars2KO_33400 [Parasphingorhabdus sp.]
MIAPIILIMAFLVVNAKLHSGKPPTIQAMVWVWAYTMPMLALAGFTRLLPAIKMARQVTDSFCGDTQNPISLL